MKNENKKGQFQLFFISIFLAFCFSNIILSCRTEHSRDPAAAERLNTEEKKRFARGRALYLKGEMQEAQIIFEELYRNEPENIQVCSSYARVLLYSGDPAGVLCVTESLPEKQRESSVDLIRLSAEAEILLGRMEEAENLLERGLKLSCEDTGLLLLLARCRKNRGKYDEALTLLETARHLTERDVAIYLDMAKIYAEYGMEKQAEEALEAGLLRLSADHPLVPALKEILNK